MQKVKCKGHGLGPIIIIIKGVAVVMVVVEFFPNYEVGEVPGGGNQVIFCKTQIEESRKTNLRLFIKEREITQLFRDER